ncbi:MAG: YIP1 family protein [Candidatus Aminicenantes bacterium]|nr:YIP1 family protein [Candidatus Aminicenantes bacterium]
MDLVQKVQSILLKPKEEWVRIKGESATVADLFMSYAMVLAAIPAVSQLLGNVLIGHRLPFVGYYKWSVGRALSSAVFTYLFSLAAVYLFALIINALAPNFASPQNMTSALKLAVYSMTPGWVAGIFYIIPALSILGILAGLYGLYILYLGFETPMMDTPKEKIMPYLGVSVLVAIGLYVILGLILGAIFAVRYSAL